MTLTTLTGHEQVVPTCANSGTNKRGGGDNKEKVCLRATNMGEIKQLQLFIGNDIFAGHED